MLQHDMTYHSDDVTLRLLSPFLAQRTLITLWLPQWFPDKAPGARAVLPRRHSEVPVFLLRKRMLSINIHLHKRELGQACHAIQAKIRAMLSPRAKAVHGSIC